MSTQLFRLPRQPTTDGSRRFDASVHSARRAEPLAVSSRPSLTVLVAAQPLTLELGRRRRVDP
jgi:hypothetical protein